MVFALNQLFMLIIYHIDTNQFKSITLIIESHCFTIYSYNNKHISLLTTFYMHSFWHSETRNPFLSEMGIDNTNINKDYSPQAF